MNSKGRKLAWIDETPVLKPENEEISYFRLVRPMLAVLQVLGRLPCSISKEGLQKARNSPLQCLYCLLVWSVQCAYSFICIQKVTISPKRRTNPIWTNFILVFIHHFIVPLCFWVDSGLLVDYISRWRRFQADYKKITKGPLKFKSSKLVGLSTALCFPITTLFLYINRHYMLGLTVTESLVTLMPILASCQMMIELWLVTFREIRAITDEITCRLIRPETRGKDAGELRILWQELKGLVKDLGDVLGYSTIAFCCSSFTNMLFTMFCVINTKQYDPYTIFIIAITLGFLLMWIFFIEMINKTSEAVGIKLAQTLLKEIMTYKSKLYVREVRLILATIQTYKPKVSLKGFFIADRNLIIVSLKSGITYLIILLQSVPRTSIPDIYEQSNSLI